MAKGWYTDVTGWKAATVASAVISEADAKGAMVIIEKVQENSLEMVLKKITLNKDC